MVEISLEHRFVFVLLLLSFFRSDGLALACRLQYLNSFVVLAVGFVLIGFVLGGDCTAALNLRIVLHQALWLF